MVSTGFCQGQQTEGHAGHLVDVVEEVVLVPGDHDDGGLQGDLEG